MAHIFKKADIPLVAIDVPHPNATYFGVDNFDVGYEAGALLAQHAQRKWKGKADWILGVGFSEAGSFVESAHHRRIRWRFGSGCRDLAAIAFCGWRAGACASRSLLAVADFLRSQRRRSAHPGGGGHRLSALGVLEAARQAEREQEFAIAGQDCIPEMLEEMRLGKSAIIGSISHEAETYGPRLIQLGIALLRGYTVPPYNYVRHRLVTPETMGAEEAEGTGQVRIFQFGRVQYRSQIRRNFPLFAIASPHWEPRSGEIALSSDKAVDRRAMPRQSESHADYASSNAVEHHRQHDPGPERIAQEDTRRSDERRLRGRRSSALTGTVCSRCSMGPRRFDLKWPS